MKRQEQCRQSPSAFFFLFVSSHPNSVPWLTWLQIISFFSPLDESQNVKLYWNISTARKEIFFTVEAKTTGWVGFGISSGQGKMEGADIVIGWVKDGQTYFKASR